MIFLYINNSHRIPPTEFRRASGRVLDNPEIYGHQYQTTEEYNVAELWLGCSWLASIWCDDCIGIDLSHKSHNAPVWFPTMHHVVSEIFFVTKWCNVGHLSNALWDLWDGYIATVTSIHIYLIEVSGIAPCPYQTAKHFVTRRPNALTSQRWSNALARPGT